MLSLGTTVIFCALAFTAGVALSMIVRWTARRASTAKQGSALATANERIREIEKELEEARDDSQKHRLKVTELEQRIHSSGMWEGKYEKLLKEHQGCATKVSQLEITKVELNLCRQQLEAVRKRSEAGGDA